MASLKYPHIWAAILEDAWAILPSKMAEITDFMAFKSSGGEFTTEEVRDRFSDTRDRKQSDSPSGYGVLPVYGTISQRAGLLQQASGGTSVDQLKQDFRAFMADSSIHTIVMDMDSPGGSVSGLTEFAEEIYKARRTKPVIAVANGLMASGAYWLAASASEIVASPSAKLGSIGVIAAHENQSEAMAKIGVDVSLITAGKYKAENNPFEPLTDEGRAEIQRRVDESYAMFTRDIARGRGVPVQTVRSGFGQGRVVGAKDAVQMGMADRIGTLDEVVTSNPRSNQSSENAMYATAPTSGAYINYDTSNHTTSIGGYDFVATGAVLPTYEEHGQRVLADVTSFAKATRDRIDQRNTQDRNMSPGHREQLEAVRAGLSEAATQLEGMLAETNPQTERLNPLALKGRRNVAYVLAMAEGV